MIEIISLIILFFGLLIASYYDLKTTEIPDKFAYIFLSIGVILFIVNSYINNFNNFIDNFIISLLISTIGFIMYFFGQWGLGDSFLLASSTFFLFFKTSKSFFIYPQLDFFSNLIIVGSFYIPLYSLPGFLRDKKAKKLFINRVKEFSSRILFLIFLFSILFLVISFYLLKQIFIRPLIFVVTFTLFLNYLWIYLKACEKMFIKRIKVNELKVGDVLLESKRWDGIDKKEIEKIKKARKKYVYIKNGVAFAPVFLISLIVTLLIGNLYSYILEFFWLLL
ncbi:MAG: prepilin peptidase [Candidatus Aenigmatarchaeota archaeon]